MTTYNGEKYLQEQLESLCRQTLQPFEVVVQDDASQDSTVAIVRSFQHRLNLKIYLNKSNIGFIKNFESALLKATGELIALCDQDDIWEKEKLEILSKEIKDFSLAYSDSLLIDQEGKSLHLNLSQKLRNHFISSNSALHFLFDNTISAHSMLFQRSLLPYILPFPENVLFDAYIGAVAASAKGVIYVNKTLVRYRQHPNNTLSKQKKEQLSLRRKIFLKAEKKAQDFLGTEKTIASFLAIKTLKPYEKSLLEELHRHIGGFSTRWFSLCTFIFFYTHRSTFFRLTKKSQIGLSFKKSFGLKAYQMFPFL